MHWAADALFGPDPDEWPAAEVTVICFRCRAPVIRCPKVWGLWMLAGAVEEPVYCPVAGGLHPAWTGRWE
jgi:hypothetical protein